MAIDYWEDAPRVLCGDCEGAGYIIQMRFNPTIDGPSEEEYECDTCDGDGWVLERHTIDAIERKLEEELNSIPNFGIM